jgi:hypothetical protein
MSQTTTTTTTDIWVVLDGYGEQVFFTKEEQYANLDNLSEQEYNKPKCSVLKNVPGFTGEGRQACRRNQVGQVVVYERDRAWKPPHPHVPAP